MALALDAHVSTRHVSFIESGRSNPSRQMVIQLAEALDVPLRERNALLSAAGYAPLYRETGLSEMMDPVQHALTRMLEQQEPHPAIVMDRHWNILMTNDGAVSLFSRFIDMDSVPQPANVLRLMFDPKWIRPFVSNWPDVATALMTRSAREAVGGVPDPEMKLLIEEIRSFPDVPSGVPNRAERSSLPIIPVFFEKDGYSAGYFSTVTTLGTPYDVTLQEIRIECFFPVDPEQPRTAS